MASQLVLGAFAALVPSPACPESWGDYLPAGGDGQRGKCFKVLRQKSWDECNAACTAEQGHQLCLRSENEAVRNLRHRTRAICEERHFEPHRVSVDRSSCATCCRWIVGAATGTTSARPAIEWKRLDRLFACRPHTPSLSTPLACLQELLHVAGLSPAGPWCRHGGNLGVECSNVQVGVRRVGTRRAERCVSIAGRPSCGSPRCGREMQPACAAQQHARKPDTGGLHHPAGGGHTRSRACECACVQTIKIRTRTVRCSCPAAVRSPIMAPLGRGGDRPYRFGTTTHAVPRRPACARSKPQTCRRHLHHHPIHHRRLHHHRRRMTVGQMRADGGLQ